MSRDNYLHKHNPETGGHACGAKVPKEFMSYVPGRSKSKNAAGEIASNAGGAKAEDYLDGPGAWCCTNKAAEVQCGKCKRLA